VRQHVPDVNLLAVEMNCRNQPELVATDIKDRELADQKLDLVWSAKKRGMIL